MLVEGITCWFFCCKRLMDGIILGYHWNASVEPWEPIDELPSGDGSSKEDPFMQHARESEAEAALIKEIWVS